ncbi:MAG: GAF domain-containing protein, partial [Anaerolineales bacterium]|nr:GAF domain-containing protein [Anaerolineales bacterium]
PLLPETRSELCLPLMVGGRLLGALDVQSRDLDAFSAADAQTLQVLADQLSIAIENAQLFRAAQTDLAEARALYLRTLEANWRDATATRPREWVFELEPGAAPAGETPIPLPLRLRDRAIGVIEFYGRPGEAPLSEEESAVLETIAAQLATALESAALIQESRARSQRDQLITAITDEMRASLNPAVILQTGIRQLGRALGDAEVTVRLQPPPRPGGDEAP